MKPTLLLRIASVLTFVHAALHTFGGLLAAPSRGAEEAAVLNAMKAFRFDIMGSIRSYWDFYFGFGIFLTVSLLIGAVILWQLANLAKADPARARPFIATMFFAALGAAAVSWRYFFAAPFITELVIAVLIALAYVASRGRPGAAV